MIIWSPKHLDTYSILKLDRNYDYLINYKCIIAGKKIYIIALIMNIITGHKIFIKELFLYVRNLVEIYKKLWISSIFYF